MHLGSCCCFWASGSSYEVADRDPILLVSGLAGSILNSKKKILGISYETRVWVRLFLADLEFRNELWSFYNPDTGWLPFIKLFLFHLFVWFWLLIFFFKIIFRLCWTFGERNWDSGAGKWSWTVRNWYIGSFFCKFFLAVLHKKYGRFREVES